MSRLRFVQTSRRLVCVLEIDGAEPRRLSRALPRLLFELRIQLLRSESRQSAGVPILRLELVEFDGGRLSEERRSELRLALISLLNPRHASAGSFRPVRAAPRDWSSFSMRAFRSNHRPVTPL